MLCTKHIVLFLGNSFLIVLSGEVYCVLAVGSGTRQYYRRTVPSGDHNNRIISIFQCTNKCYFFQKLYNILFSDTSSETQNKYHAVGTYSNSTPKMTETDLKQNGHF